MGGKGAYLNYLAIFACILCSFLIYISDSLFNLLTLFYIILFYSFPCLQVMLFRVGL